jgi:sugar lactone lactonase YvrE
VDADGLFWVAVFRAGKVAAYRPDGGLERLIDMPVKLPSSVAFGGPQLDRLYVTTIAHDVAGAAHGGHADEPDAQAGSLFVIEGLGARGRPEPAFAG